MKHRELFFGFGVEEGPIVGLCLDAKEDLQANLESSFSTPYTIQSFDVRFFGEGPDMVCLIIATVEWEDK